MDSVRPRNIYVKFLHCRTNAADYLRGPEAWAEEDHPAVFGLADGTTSVAGIRGLIGIETAAREFFLELGVAVLCRTAKAHAKGFTFKTLEEFRKLRFTRLRQHQAALGGFAIMNFVKLAEFANAFDVAEEINDEEFIGSESGKDGSPNQRRVLAADGFAVLGFEQLQPDGLDIGTEVEGFHVEGKRRQLQGAGIEQRFAGGAHISDSVRGNFARKSDACLRTSSQSKKASGVSSQMRNQLAISTFSARLLGSTLGLREIISARRLPRRAMFRTRSTAARSPWV